jgi:subtilisin family serine protease
MRRARQALRVAARPLLLLALALSLGALPVGQGAPGPEVPALLALHGAAAPVDAWLAAHGAQVTDDFAGIGVQRVLAPAPVLDALRALPGVASVQPEEQEGLLLSSSRAAVGVGPQLWDGGADGSGVVVAVVDSGIDAGHPDLQGRVVRAVHVDAGGVTDGGGDRDGHGTHIAGIVAGDGAASQGREAGMAPKAQLVAVDISASFTTTNAVRAFQWLHEHAAELGVRVVSCSWGREKEGARYDPDDPVIRAADQLVDDGLVVVFSAGNRGPGPGTLTVEAQDPRVITVGASDDEGRVASYSSRGPAYLPDGSEAAWTKPDLVAPGSFITSARAGGRSAQDAYVEMNGTSMAAPHVAGIVALLLSAQPALGPDEVKDALLRSARDRGAAGADPDTGHGFPDASAALDLVRPAGAPLVVQPFGASGSVVPVAGLLPQGLGAGRSEVRQAVVVGVGAVRVDVRFRWDDARSAFELGLERGAERIGPLGTVTEDGAWRTLEASVPGPLAPGTWDLVARSSGPSVATHYELSGDVVLRGALVAHSVPPHRAQPPLLEAALPPEAQGPGPWLLALPGAAVVALLFARGLRRLSSRR